MDEVSQAIERVRAKRASDELAFQSHYERTKQLWRRASHLYWEYKYDFIRGDYKFSSGVPHVFKRTAPAYLLSKSELTSYGLRPSGGVWPVCHTYNEQAGLHYLYDARDCTAIKGAAAKTRLQKTITGLSDGIAKGYCKRREEVLLRILQEIRDIPF